MSAMRVRWTRYGRVATEALCEEIVAAKAHDPLAPVAVVVPSNQVGVSVRRELARGSAGSANPAGPGLLAVTFLTPYRLAELLGAAPLADAGRRPVSTPVLAAAMRRALADDPGSFGPVADHPATEAALVAAYQELREVSDPGRAALARAGGRAAELVRMVDRARSLLADDWYDQEDLMAAATAALADSPGPGADLGTVVVHLPQHLGRHAIDLLRALPAGPSAAGTVVIAGRTGVEAADREVDDTVTRLSASPGTPGRSASPETPALSASPGTHSPPLQLGLFGAAPSSPPDLPSDERPGEVLALRGVVDSGRTIVVTTSDADEEVRAAVRLVVDEVRAGTPLDRIAVLHAAPEPYARLLHDHLAAAGITTNGTSPIPLAGRVAARVLLGLLALHAEGVRRDDVFAWATGFPLVQDGAWLPVAAWERVSRAAGVVAGRAHWDRRLERHAAERERDADRYEQDPERAGSASSARREAAQARALRRFVLGLVDRLDEGRGLHPWSTHAARAAALIDELLGRPEQDERWTDDERRGAVAVSVALDRLAALDAVEGAVDEAVFARTLAVELEATHDRIGRFGTGVLVGPVSLGLGVDLDLVIVVGLAEGTFPAPAREDSLLPDDHRLATGELALRRHQPDRLHHQFLATLAGARRHALTVPLGDLRRSRERVPSRWVLEIATELAGTRLWSKDLLAQDAAAHHRWLRPVPSFDAGLRTGEPATEQQHRLRRLLAHPVARPQLGALAATIDPHLAAGVEVLDARRSPVLTRFDGNLAGLPVASPVEVGSSATLLETWVACPHRYLVQHLLGVRPVDQPEQALEISALDRGNLVHHALEDFVTEVLGSGDVPAPDQPWTDAHHRRLAEIGAARGDEYAADGRTGHDVFWQRDRRQILAELDQVLVRDDARRRRHRATPIAAELPFGQEGVAPAAYPLPDGRVLRLRGRADRVDRGEDGSLRVVDYKTGSTRNYTNLAEDDPHQHGQHLQLAVYGLAARQQLGPAAAVTATYWFTSTKGGWTELGYPITDAVLDDVGRALQAAVAGIERGLFPPRPDPPDTKPWVSCPVCDPDELGTGDLHRSWLAKAADPALRSYLELLGVGEPDALGEPAP